MAITDNRLSATALLATLPHGKSVTPRQLESWRQADLLPRPEREYLGKGRGTRSLYPPETVEQLQTLLKLRETTDDTHALRTFLWVLGYPVPPERVRESMCALWERTYATILAGVVERGDPAEHADAVIQGEMSRRRSLLNSRSARRGLSKAEQTVVVTQLLTLVLGGGWLAGKSAEHDEATLGDLSAQFIGVPHDLLAGGTDNLFRDLTDAGLLNAKRLSEVLTTMTTKGVEELLPRVQRWLVLLGLLTSRLENRPAARLDKVEIVTQAVGGDAVQLAALLAVLLQIEDSARAPQLEQIDRGLVAMMNT